MKMPMPRAQFAALLLPMALLAPTQLSAAGGGGGGYVSDAPIPWHLTHDDEGRSVIELIESAETRLGLEFGNVVAWSAPETEALEPVDSTAPEILDAADSSDQPPQEEPLQEQVWSYLAIPYQSLIYWSDGSTWVYVEVSARHYARMPVEIFRIDGDAAVFVKGPAEGTRVVTLGAAELFGAETGTGH